MSYRLGVDLGTTYSAAAVVRGEGPPKIVVLGDRSTVIPSVVLVTNDGRVLAGEAAARRESTEPAGVIREFKRRIGDPNPIQRGGIEYRAVQLMAEMFSTVLDIVQGREGGPPEAIVLTHPANWSQSKRDGLLAAVSPVTEVRIELLTEPEAAAISYATNERIEPGEIVAVYDLGGGTFDVAVLQRTETGFEVIGRPGGIERLGGIDFDAAVLAHVNDSLDGALDKLSDDNRATAVGLARLKVDAVDAKEGLSSATDAGVPVHLPGLQTEIRITRVEFERMIRPALADTVGALRKAITSAGVTPADVHALLLVGGSSRIPLVAQLVGAELNRPVAIDAHPKHAVALGAAAAAALLQVDEAVPEVAEPAIVAEPLAPAVVAEPVIPEPVASELADPVLVKPVADRSGRLLWLGAAAVLLILAVGGIVLATRDSGNPEVAGVSTSTAAESTALATSAATNSTVVVTTTTVVSTTAQQAPTTQAPTPAVTATCEAATTPFVCITSVLVDGNGNIVAEFDRSGFLPLIGPAPNRHVHFFFPVGTIADDPTNAGSAGPNFASWIAWDDPTFGPGFRGAGYTLSDAAEVGATELCVLVAESGHAVVLNTGNCVPLPPEALE